MFVCSIIVVQLMTSIITVSMIYRAKYNRLYYYNNYTYDNNYIIITARYAVCEDDPKKL